MDVQIPSISEVLPQLNVSSGYNGLPGLKELAALANLETFKYAKKSEVVSALLHFYQHSFSPVGYYQALPKPQQALAAYLVQSNGGIEEEELLQLMAQYDLKLQRKVVSPYYSYYPYSNVSIQDYFPLSEPFWLLFPGGLAVREIFSTLSSFIGPLKLEETEFLPPASAVVICREQRHADYSGLVRYCNQTRAGATKNGLLSKGAALGFWRQAQYPEVTDTLSVDAAEVRVLQKLRVTLPLYLTALNGGLLEIVQDKLNPGKNAAQMLAFPPEKLIKRLYQAYQESNSLREPSYLSGIRELRGGVQCQNGRKVVCDLLRQYPVGRWLSVAGLTNYLRRTKRGFLRTHESQLAYSKNAGYSVRWADGEARFVYFVLSVYGALGLLDLAWEMETESQWETGFHLIDDEKESESIPVCFRITALGAFVLGITCVYQSPQPVKEPMTTSQGFYVQPDYTILLPESAARLQHELYFERFLTVCGRDAQMSNYRLDVEGIIRLLNLGETVASLLDYLQGGSEKPIPDNIRRAFADWEEMAGKLRIRTVTILETDDPALLEEVVRYKGIEAQVLGRIGCAAVLNPNETKKVKAILEKNKRYCKDEYTR